MISSNLLTKEETNYRACNEMSECCQECMSFKAPDKCDTVEGPVDATMTCDEFSDGGDLEEAPVAPAIPPMPV